MPNVISLSDRHIVWNKHPHFPGVQIAWLMQKARGESDFDSALVRMSADAEVFEHVHAAESDTLYVLRGSATMWIDGIGEVALRQGSFLRIPPGIAHRPYGFTDDFTAFNFWPTGPA